MGKHISQLIPSDLDEKINAINKILKESEPERLEYNKDLYGLHFTKAQLQDGAKTIAFHFINENSKGTLSTGETDQLIKLMNYTTLKAKDFDYQLYELINIHNAYKLVIMSTYKKDFDINFAVKYGAHDLGVKEILADPQSIDNLKVGYEPRI